MKEEIFKLYAYKRQIVGEYIENFNIFGEISGFLTRLRKRINC